MEIKTSEDIRTKSNFTSVKEMKIYIDKKWVVVDDYEKLKSLANEMFEQLEIMDYENKAKETYDEFKKELNSQSNENKKEDD